jgi:uncharacterized protein DUF4424
MRLRRILTFLGLAVLCGAARANDTRVTLGAGGLVPIKSNQIVMESEDLQISLHKIAIHYVFRNPTQHDVETLVGFPLPDLNGETLYYSPVALPRKDHANFLNFKVEAKGKAVPVKVETRAFLGDRDVTTRLHAAGLTSSVFLGPSDAALPKVSAAERSKLEKEGLIDEEGNADQGWVPAWSMRVQFYWTQKFPAHQTVELTQTYQPVVGGSYTYLTPNDDQSAFVKPYCGGADALHMIAEITRQSAAFKPEDAILIQRDIDYILTTGNNWNGPIRNFHLTVLTDSPDDILLTCMKGLKRAAPARYEFGQSDFHPSEELKLAILQAYKPKRPSLNPLANRPRSEKH